MDSDKSNSYQHHSDITSGRNIDILEGNADSESTVGILTYKFNLYQNSLGQPGELHDSL